MADLVARNIMAIATAEISHTPDSIRAGGRSGEPVASPIGARSPVTCVYVAARKTDVCRASPSAGSSLSCSLRAGLVHTRGADRVPIVG